MVQVESTFAMIVILSNTIKNFGQEYCDNIECGLCEGDCDGDEQCKGDLKCFKRDGYEKVPGCDGGNDAGDCKYIQCTWNRRKLRISVLNIFVCHLNLQTEEIFVTIPTQSDGNRACLVECIIIRQGV